MTHKFDSESFFTFLVALAHGVAPPVSDRPEFNGAIIVDSN